ncbi:MAG: CotH kinase family protein, partial [Candidatus Eiseniibacteriota bacterium]
MRPTSFPLPSTAASLVVALVLAAVAPAPGALAYEQHFNCAGGAYLAQDGRQFEADRAYATGDAGYLDGWAQGTANWYPIAGTADRPIYEVTRNSVSEYRFDLPNDDYLVELLLVENFKHSTGETIFDVSIEGQEVVSNLDIYERVLRDHAINFLLPVTVTDGQLNVTFHADRGISTIAGISVRSRVPDSTPPAQPQGLEAVDSYLAINLRWDANTEDDLAGYRVEFSSSAGGPFFPTTAPGGDIERVTWRMDPASPGETWYYRVVAIDAYGNESMPSDVVSGTVRAHADAPLPLVEVLIDPDTLEVLNDAPASNDYHAFQLEFDGDPGLLFDGVGRYRGNVMRSVRKKSWKFKMDLGTYDDRETFNLNAEYSDKSLLRQRLSYEIMRRDNCYAPETRYVHLVVNGDWQGVRLDIENVNRDFLRRVGLEENNATMYRPREDVGMVADGNLAPLPTVQDYMDIYEKELGDPQDYSDLIAFIESLNNLPSNQKFNWLAGTMNLNRLFDFYSSEVVLQNNDIGYKNYFLHHDLDTGEWTIIPWDVDLTWGNTWPFYEVFVTTSSIHLGATNRLFQLIAQQPILYQLHYDRIRQILVSSFAPGAAAALIDSVYQEVADEGLRDWWKWGWQSDDEFVAGPALMQQFVDERSAFLLQQIAQFEEPSDLCINEVMASNNTAVTDEWGDYDDWVELYNRGSQPVSLAGLHLTDDLTVPGKLALPDT